MPGKTRRGGTGEQGLKTLKMVNAIIESANTHQVVVIS